MTKQMRNEYKTLATICVVLVGVSGLIYLMPRAHNISSVSSRDLDDSLYEHLDDYLQALEDDEALAEIFATAMTDPDQLSATERQLFLDHEREFLSGWELAWTYRADGYLETDRYREWDAWYVDEVNRRPEFVWTENKHHFPEAFTRHVEESINHR